MSSSIDLSTIDEFLLKRVVKQFSATSGVRFYRSCKMVRDLVDCAKPVWPLPYSSLSYKENKRVPKIKSAASGEWMELDPATILPPFCRIGSVLVSDCSSEYIQTVILPEFEASPPIEMLLLVGRVSGENVRLLLAATKPETASLWYNGHDVTSDDIKNVKDLHLLPVYNSQDIYSTTNRLFELARDRKSITLTPSHSFYEHTVLNFLKKWLNGESTGSLEKLTVIRFTGSEIPQHVNEMFQREIEKLIKTDVYTPEGYIVERGPDRLRICVDWEIGIGRVAFHFS